jgi:hypothetical protein
MPARSYVAGNFQLVLDGVKCGFLKSVDGGAAVAEVISESVGSSCFAKKHLGQGLDWARQDGGEFGPHDDGDRPPLLRADGVARRGRGAEGCQGAKGGGRETGKGQTAKVIQSAERG